VPGRDDMAITEEPRKPQNAYWIFLSDNRDALTKEAGSSSGPAVGKVAGAKWKGMSAAAKAPYEKRAVAAKAQYDKDIQAFKAAGGEVGKRRAEKAEAKREKAGKRARKAKDPNKPKKPASAYWLWLNDQRATIMAEIEKKHGKKVVTEVSKIGGERWKTVAEKAKAPYEKKAVELRKKYEKDIVEYRKNNADAGDDDDEDEEDGGEEA